MITMYFHFVIINCVILLYYYPSIINEMHKIINQINYLGVSVAQEDTNSGTSVLALAGSNVNTIGGSRVEANKPDTFFQVWIIAIWINHLNI